MMKSNVKYSICGDFVDKNITGIQRVAWETIKELDKIIPKGLVELVVPKDAKEVPQYSNINIVRIHDDGGNRHLWIQLWYGTYIVKNKRIGITMCNELPIIKPGISYWYDVYYKTYPQDFVSIRDKISRLIVLMMYRASAKHAKHIVVDSKFVGKEIESIYHVRPERISVAYCGWQHMLNSVESKDLFERYPNVKANEYYFTLGSLAKRKNVAWTIEYAKKHPDSTFVLSGRMDNFFVDENIPENILLIGYASDEDVIAWMKNCKAFIFPSIYEGFGIPPLEAISLGARAIVARNACLPEVYEDAVHYINTDSIDVDLDKLLSEELKQKPEELLEKYSWTKSAEVLKEILYGKSKV